MVLQMMKNQGIKINENMFNSLILGHGEAGDLLKVMKQWGLSPSLETFLNLILAFGYSKAEDWRFVEKEMAEDEDQVYNDYMELMLMPPWPCLPSPAGPRSPATRCSRGAGFRGKKTKYFRLHLSDEV